MLHGAARFSFVVVAQVSMEGLPVYKPTNSLYQVRLTYLIIMLTPDDEQATKVAIEITAQAT